MTANSTSRTFYIADVFAEEKYAGNQLAVIRDSDGLTDADMLKITREMSYSETTFILSETEKEGGYDVRIFTPGGEVPFAGHPTLGTATVIREKIAAHPANTIKLNLKVGQIPVTFGDPENPGVVWMKQMPPTFGETFTPADLAPVLRLNIDDFDPRFPIQTVSTGLPFFIVPLKTREAVVRARVNLDACVAFVEGKEADAFLIFCPEPYSAENTLNARMFADMHGVVEDPATGSANGCLAGYLVKNRYFGKPTIDVRVEQGYEINRPSRLYLKAAENSSVIDVFVGGKVVMVAEGKLI